MYTISWLITRFFNPAAPVLLKSHLAAFFSTFLFKYSFPYSRNQWRYIINTDSYKQGLSINKCLDAQESCKYNGEPGFYPNATACNQLYTRHDLLAISPNGYIEYDSFKVPSACICKILDTTVFEIE